MSPVYVAKAPWTVVCTMMMLTALSNGVAAGGMNSGGHGHNGQGQSHQNTAAEIGQPGTVTTVDRTIKVSMIDSLYAPKEIAVRPGETIRFVIENKGEIVHEFSIGTPDMHKHHQKEMAAMFEKGHLEIPEAGGDHPAHSEMNHDDPNSLLLAPNKTGEIIWKFNRPARLEFACNVPGHYEAGMRGRFQWTESHAPAH